MLTWLVWHVRRMWCRHKWTYAEASYVHRRSSSSGTEEYNNVVVSATCTQCGWHRSYNKWRL